MGWFLGGLWSSLASMAETEAVATGYGPVVATAPGPKNEFFHLDQDADPAGWLAKHLPNQFVL